MGVPHMNLTEAIAEVDRMAKMAASDRSSDLQRQLATSILRNIAVKALQVVGEKYGCEYDPDAFDFRGIVPGDSPDRR